MRKKLSREKRLRNDAIRLMRVLHSVRPTISNPLDFADEARAAIARVLELSDINVRGPRKTKRTVLPPPETIFERIAEEFPAFDPILCCCGVWSTQEKRALPPHLIRPAVPLGSVSYRAMAQRYGVWRRSKYKNDVLRYTIRPKRQEPPVGAQGVAKSRPWDGRIPQVRGRDV